MNSSQEPSSSSWGTSKSQSSESFSSAMKPSSVVAVKYWTLPPAVLPASPFTSGTSMAFMP